MKSTIVCLAVVLVLQDLASGDDHVSTTIPKSCPEGKFVANCKMPPCSVASCTKYPNAECRNDYCGACLARFFIDGQEVTSKCSSTTQPGLCNDGREPVKCETQPCSVSYCPKHEYATCIDEFCGGCKARWYMWNMEVTDDCSGCFAVPVNKCPNSDRVTCFIRPCDTRQAKCTHIPDATCFDDYCKSCNARWFLSDCTEVTTKCQDTPS